jgi:L,D-peptidoglycan transpeptidase YkuD (ErfK/YbiS/YcfS/YnhG family)
MTTMDIVVETASDTATQGVLVCDGRRYACALGRSGIVDPALKVEGDGKTPLGIFPLRQVFYRADRVARPITGLATEELRPDTGWDENPESETYNTCIRVAAEGPAPAGIDRMTRDDHVYDITVVIGYNDDPPQKGRGSAIFMHVARPGYTPTAGCVALSESDLRDVLAKLTPASRIRIQPPG